MINERTMVRLLNQLDKDKLFVFQGGGYDFEEKYLEPTILSADLDDKLWTMEEEIFGPILPVIGYNELDEAVKFIKSYGKPLAFYPFSSNKEELDFYLKH